MSNKKTTSRTERNCAAGKRLAVSPPGDFVELAEFHVPSIARQLGYLGDDPFVLFGYCPWVFEVIWRDGRAFGFGNDGWRTYLLEIGPVAKGHGADIGTTTCLGTHVLLMDRLRKRLYAARRESAEKFLARLYGKPSPERPCLCPRTSCVHCPPSSRVRSQRDGREGPGDEQHESDDSLLPPALCTCTVPA